MIVDASVLGDDGECGRQARDLLREHRDLAAPDLVDVQTTAILRRRWLAGTITDQRFEQAVEDLTDIPLARFATLGLMRRPSSGAQTSPPMTRATSLSPRRSTGGSLNGARVPGHVRDEVRPRSICDD